MLGLGVDIIRVRRVRLAIERSGQAFIDRIFTREEIAACSRMKAPKALEGFAMIFALKESVIKALGGLRQGMRWTNIQAPFDNAQNVDIRLQGEIGLWAATKGVSRIEASASSKGGIAIAVVILLGLGSSSQGTLECHDRSANH